MANHLTQLPQVLTQVSDTVFHWSLGMVFSLNVDVIVGLEKDDDVLQERITAGTKLVVYLWRNDYVKAVVVEGPLTGYADLEPTDDDLINVTTYSLEVVG